MNLKEIGFYTLSDERARTATHTSPLQRCELLVTQRCNFNCPYCRKLEGSELSKQQAIEILNLWAKDGLRNIRFSGGEPTLWKPLVEIVYRTKQLGIKRIAVSTNGSANPNKYKELIKAGVNDFSVSLDACCSSTGNIMSGTLGKFYSVAENIRRIYQAGIYISVGVVLTDENIGEVDKIVEFAHSLGVSDIRIIPAAQHSKALPEIQPGYKMCYPILKYRLNNMKEGGTVRGLKKTDNHRCPLVLDDMAVWDGHHYPCIIYLREGGAPIGKVCDNMRLHRLGWYYRHICQEDEICKGNCLDVCVDYNNRVRELQEIGRRNWEK